MSGHLTIEALLVAGISCVGAAALRLLVPRLGAPLTIMFSGLVGVLVVALTSVISIGVGVSNNPWYVAFLAAALLASSFVIEVRRSNVKVAALSIGGAALAGGLVTFGIGLLVAPILTFDSWRFLEHGSSVFGDGSTVDLLLERSLGNYPISLVSLQGLAQELDIPFMASGMAAVGALGVAGAFELFARPLEGTLRALRLSLIVVLTIGIAMSSYITRLQLGYVNAHAMTAGFYALGIAGVFAPEGESPRSPLDEPIRAVAIGISCAGLALGRVEGLLLAAFILIAAVTLRGWSFRSLRIIALLGLAVPVLWYVRLATTLIDAEILAPSTLTVLILVASAPLLLAAVSKPGLPIPWLATMTMLALGGASLVVALLNPAGFGVSVSNLVLNLISTGLWGAIWWVALPLSAMALWRMRTVNARGSWLVVTLGFVLVVLILGGVRDFPYSARWGDSANRMMIHVLPTFFLLIFSAFGSAEDTRLATREKETV